MDTNFLRHIRELGPKLRKYETTYTYDRKHYTLFSFGEVRTYIKNKPDDELPVIITRHITRDTYDIGRRFLEEVEVCRVVV